MLIPAASPLRHRTLLAAAVTVAWAVFGPSPGRTADELEKQLVMTARTALQQARQSNHRNLGVLKFAVRYAGTQRLVDGALPSRMAQQLERALVLQNDPSDPLGIIRDASSIAAELPGVDHTSAAGREQLFSTVYPLAWGKAKVVPDAFLSGVAEITPDRRRLRVATFRFDSDDLNVQLVSEFEVRMDLEDLIDIGESFLVRGLFDHAKLKMTDADRREEATEQAVLTAKTTAPKETAGNESPAAEDGDAASGDDGNDDRLTAQQLAKRHPLSAQNAESPVRLKILYDGRPQPLSFPSGVAVVQPPQPGQAVSLEVSRTGESRERLGVVLKVNGENTLFRQTEPDARCRFWILEPHMNRFGVYAFHMKDDLTEAFRVLSDQQSAEREIDYGEFAGTISITVFGERPAAAKPADGKPAESRDDQKTAGDEDNLFALLRDSAAPEETPSTLAALKRHFGQSRMRQERGLIVPGSQGVQKLQTQPFDRDPVPRMTATVRYNNPSDLPL